MEDIMAKNSHLSICRSCGNEVLNEASKCAACGVDVSNEGKIDELKNDLNEINSAPNNENSKSEFCYQKIVVVSTFAFIGMCLSWYAAYNVSDNLYYMIKPLCVAEPGYPLTSLASGARSIPFFLSFTVSSIIVGGYLGGSFGKKVDSLSRFDEKIGRSYFTYFAYSALYGYLCAFINSTAITYIIYGRISYVLFPVFAIPIIALSIFSTIAMPILGIYAANVSYLNPKTLLFKK